MKKMLNKISVKNIGWSVLLLLAVQVSYSQNYTSIASGAWTTAANWNNTSGWGGATPSIPYNSGTLNINHNMNIGGSASFGGTVNINAAGTLTLNANLTVNGGGTINVYGTLIVAGNITLNGNLRVQPGGKVVVEGSVTVVSSTYLTIGTAVAPPPYADMVIYQDLAQQGSGDVTINRNGRLAVFGNVTDSGGGGTFIQVNNGGQAYVHGDITYSGGGSSIQNNNTTNPYGLYVNGTATSSGGGGTVTTNMGDQQTMQDTNPDFFSWVSSHPNSPMPVTLLYFKVNEIEESKVVLVWATSKEQDFDYFEVEHSTNGHTFVSIGTQTGAGYNTESVQNYTFTDSNPVIGSNYYRLKAVDLDGSVEYFNIVFANVKADKQLAIYPNPSDGKRITTQLNFEPLHQAKIQVSDLTGIVVAETAVTGIEVDVEFSTQLKPGVYLVTYYAQGFKRTERLLVR